MIDVERAKQIALDYIEPDCGLIDEATLEKPYGWYFRYQSREYLKTQDLNYFLYGGTHFIVERDSARIVPLGSNGLIEEHIDAYEKGFKYQRYDLTITAIQDRAVTIQHLYNLHLSRMVVETVCGEEKQEYKRYGQIILDGLLRRLPCVFYDQRFGVGNYKIFGQIDASRCCSYKLCEHQADYLPDF